MKKQILGALLVVLLASLMACNDADADAGADDDVPGASAADPATTNVRVHYRDSSVPPEFHRSWELTLDRDTVHLVVDSYGDVLADETVDMPAREWDAFVSDLGEAVAGLDDPEAPEQGCAGGNGISLEIDGAGNADTSLEVQNCNTPANLAIMEDIEAMIEPFTGLVDLDKHTRV